MYLYLVYVLADMCYWFNSEAQVYVYIHAHVHVCMHVHVHAHVGILPSHDSICMYGIVFPVTCNHSTQIVGKQKRYKFT